MRYTIFTLASFFLLNACGADAPGSDKPEPAVVSTANEVSVPPPDSMICVTGLLLVRDSIIQLFEPKENKMFKIKDHTGTIMARHAEACLPVAYTVETTHAVICGTLLGASRANGIQTLNAFRVDTIVAKTAENLDAPFEFWCRGTSPKWDIEICNLEGGIFYQNEGDGTGWFCAWSPPVVNGNKWTYNIPAAQGMNGAITLVIRKEKTSDGVSDKKYDYSAEVTVGGKQLKGVAIRGTAPLEGPPPRY